MSSVPCKEILSYICELGIGGFSWALPGGTGAGGYSWWLSWGSRELGLQAGGSPVPCAACLPSPHTRRNAGAPWPSATEIMETLWALPHVLRRGRDDTALHLSSCFLSFFCGWKEDYGFKGEISASPPEKEERGKGSNETFLSANLTTA